jgi:hypothetical protein
VLDTNATPATVYFLANKGSISILQKNIVGHLFKIYSNNCIVTRDIYHYSGLLVNHRIMSFSVFMCMSYLHGMDDTQFNKLLVNSLNFFQLETCAYLEQKKTVQTQNTEPNNTQLAKFIGKHQSNTNTPEMFACNLGCKKVLRSKSGLKKHIRRDHPEQLQHVCLVCQDRFFTRSGLEQHTTIMHPILKIRQ